LAERAARTKKLLEETQKREAESAKSETKESLINDLMSDEEEANGASNQEDVEMSEVNA
jgi:hypothetical protein